MWLCMCFQIINFVFLGLKIIYLNIPLLATIVLVFFVFFF